MIVQPIGKFKLTYANGISQVVNNSPCCSLIKNNLIEKNLSVATPGTGNILI